MTEVPQVIEGENIVLPDYSGHVFSDTDLAKNAHRSYVCGRGGEWDEGGRAQLDFLTKQGLRPEHKVVDIGCGALRAGRHLVDYVGRGNYYGVDANHSVMQAGWDRELTDAQRTRLPIGNLRANDRFDVDFGVRFDMAIAQSVFTHVSLNHLLLCLERLGRMMRPGGQFFASYVEVGEEKPIDHIFQKAKNGRTYFYEKNVYWYHRSDMRWAASAGSGGWSFKYIGGYGSPQGQVMGVYTKLETSATGEAQRKAARGARADAALKAGGAARFVVRARRKAASIVNPY